MGRWTCISCQLTSTIISRLVFLKLKGQDKPFNVFFISLHPLKKSVFNYMNQIFISPVSLMLCGVGFYFVWPCLASQNSCRPLYLLWDQWWFERLQSCWETVKHGFSKGQPLWSAQEWQMTCQYGSTTFTSCVGEDLQAYFQCRRWLKGWYVLASDPIQGKDTCCK